MVLLLSIGSFVTGVILSYPFLNITPSEAGYIEVDKTFQGKRPRTVCKMTEKGREAFLQYVTALQEYIAPALAEERQVRIESEKDSIIPKGGLALC